MRDKGEHNRSHIINAADKLFYHKGYNQTSFSDIADESGVPRGNIYYYYRTKDELLSAVIDWKLKAFNQMFKNWEETIPVPIERIKKFVQYLIDSSEEVRHYGCPVGSLNIELAKSQRELQTKTRELFDLLRHWLKKQFLQMNLEDNAEDLALQFLSRTQGINVVAQVYDDTTFLEQETTRIHSWLDQLK